MGNDVIVDQYARLFEFPYQLAKQGNEVSAVCLSYYGSSTGQFDHDLNGQGSLKWYGFNSGPFYILGLPYYLFRTYKLIKTLKPDVLIGSSDAPHIILTRLFSILTATPYIADLYDNYESFKEAKVPGIKSLYRLALKKANAITAVSTHLAKYVKQIAPGVTVAALESTIDPNCFFRVDSLEFIEKYGLPKSGRLIGAAGSLGRNRGIKLLYDAFLKLVSNDPSLYLILAGDIDAKMPPPDHKNIIYLGRIAHDQMPAFYSALDVAVLCMIDTPFGRYAFPQKTYELMVCETPFVTANIGVLGELLRSSPSCLYQVGNVQSLIDSIVNQLDNAVIPDLYVPSWEEQGRTLLSVLEEGINGSN